MSRRRLFAGAGSIAAVAAVASVIPAREDPPAAAQADTPPDKRAGYRLTEHIQRYYQTARV
ncbi:formate dehydrogenase [Caldimonas sp.]|uniref:formate dehydrogenase n=1 Tax=Caldimonas sp. TaxID=2838790 RepID=UPI003919536A